MINKVLSYIIKILLRSKMSSHTASPNSVATNKATNKAVWSSPIIKPLPKSLLRSFHYESKNKTDQKQFFDEDDEQENSNEEECESSKFASFASDWAQEDKARNEKLDMLEAIEDCMETNMRLSDQLVRLITKMKRELRSF